MLLFWAVPSWTPRAKPQLPGTLPQTPPPRRGYLGNPLLVPWSLCNFTHLEVSEWLAFCVFNMFPLSDQQSFVSMQHNYSALRVRLSSKPVSVCNSQLEVNTKTRRRHHYHKLIVYRVDSQEGSALNR